MCKAVFFRQISLYNVLVYSAIFWIPRISELSVRYPVHLEKTVWKGPIGSSRWFEYTWHNVVPRKTIEYPSPFSTTWLYWRLVRVIVIASLLYSKLSWSNFGSMSCNKSWKCVSVHGRTSTYYHPTIKVAIDVGTVLREFREV